MTLEGGSPESKQEVKEKSEQERRGLPADASPADISTYDKELGHDLVPINAALYDAMEWVSHARSPLSRLEMEGVGGRHYILDISRDGLKRAWKEKYAKLLESLAKADAKIDRL